MSTRYEGADASYTSADWEKPGAEIGEDKLGPGKYALLISADEVFYIEGTPEELRGFMVRLDQQLQYIEAHAQRPVGFGDIVTDEDGTYLCPQCDSYWAPQEHDDLLSLVTEVTRHIEKHAPTVKA